MTSDLEHLTEAARQLADIWPRLRDALAKDQTGTDGRASGTTIPSIPVNPDVLDTIASLADTIPATDQQLRTALLFDRAGTVARRSVNECLTYADALWRRLHAHPDLEDQAAAYADTIHRWLADARRAIGLSQRPKPLNIRCPFCDGNLNLTGDEAELHQPDDVEAITWSRGETIYCTECKREWPSNVWDILGNIINRETERRQEHAS